MSGEWDSFQLSDASNQKRQVRGERGGRQSERRNGITVCYGAERVPGSCQDTQAGQAVLVMDQSGHRTQRGQPIRGLGSLSHADPDTEWEESLSPPVKSLLTKCQIKNCYKHFLNRSIESTSIPTPLAVYLLWITRRQFHQVDDGFFEVNEIVLWAAFGRTAGKLSVLRAGRGRDGMGMVCGLGAWRLF